MAIGAGWVLAVSCDLVVAADSAQFSLPFTRLGVCPDAASTSVFPQLVGRLRSAELMLLGDRIDAPTANEWGLITRMVPEDQVQTTARELSERLASGAPLALRAAKRLLDEPGDQAFAEQIMRESLAQGRLGHSRDIGRAVAAFKERRAPAFEGD
jgi:2-(1,2-epoxy-1,2-dihydrophenyl)acetyl-CoA isomerase